MSKSIEITLEEVEKYLNENYTDIQIDELVDDVKGDYLDQDWEDEFENEYEAYQEQGRGEAENHVRRDIENDLFNYFYKDFPQTNHEQRQLLYAMYEQSTGEQMWDTINRIFENLDKD